MIIFIILSSILAFVSYVVYIIAILKGKAKPHRTTRFVLVIITFLATISLIAKGSTVAVWLSGVFTFGSLAIFLLSIQYGMGGWAKTDVACLGVSLFGIIFWQVTKDPLFGLFASIGADVVSQIPMLIKTYKFPYTEVWTFYFLDVLAAICSLLAVGQWTMQEYSYPFYIIFIDGLTIFLILRPKIIRIIA